MGLTKNYLKFVPGPTFGIIGSSSGKVIFANIGNTVSDHHVAVSACENVIIWNCHTNEKVCTLHGEKHAVSSIAQDVRKRKLAVGYADGAIRLFDLVSGDCIVMFSGHKSAVSSLSYDDDGMRLVSGGMDTDIIIWDVPEERGLFRLQGHKGVVTQVKFLKQKNYLISCSKDSLIKFWDLNAQHCFKTVVGNNNEIWDFVVLQDSNLFVVNDEGFIDVLNLNFPQTDDDENIPEKLEAESLMDVEENNISEKLKSVNLDDDDRYVKCTEIGKISINSERRRICFNVDATERLFGYHTYGKSLQLFKVLTEEEIQKKVHRRKKRERKQQKLKGEEVNVASNNSILIEDQLDLLKAIKFSQNISSFSTRVVKGSMAKIVVLFKNNSVAIYDLNINQNQADMNLQYNILSPGHRTEIRALSFSSDSVNILSASSDCAKIWDVDRQECIATVPCDYAVSSLFAPGNNHFLIGTKLGQIQLFDVSSNTLLEEFEAHNGSVSCMCLSPDLSGLVSGGEDKSVKFWDFSLVEDKVHSSTKKRLSISITKVLKLEEQVLCVKCSPDGRQLAVSLLDSTVKVFFVDTLKYHFTLFGHKLPILSMDISYDSTIIATGSSDRNVKIWSMEFGNCNKSLFAHEDGITCVQFLAKTHMFFTAGKDRKIKQWDADNFQKIITLEGHQDHVTSLCVSPDGTCVVSASNDKSLRLWEKTDEMLELGEEQEMEREAELDKDIISRDTVVIPGETEDVTVAGKLTAEVLKSTDLLVGAIDVYNTEASRLEEYERQCKIEGMRLPMPEVNPFLVQRSTTCPARYMLKVFCSIRPNDLEVTLMHMSFAYAVKFLEILQMFIEKKWEVERSSRCLLFLVRIHFGQLSASSKLYAFLCKLKGTQYSTVGHNVDLFGSLKSGVTYLLDQVNSSTDEWSFADISKSNEQKKKRKRGRKRKLSV